MGNLILGAAAPMILDRLLFVVAAVVDVPLLVLSVFASAVALSSVLLWWQRRGGSR